MTGMELIAQEREEQIAKHGYQLQHDEEANSDGQLSFASSLLVYPTPEAFYSPLNNYGCPNGWSVDLWKKMIKKPYRERLIIAGALIAAEIDRIQV